MSDFDPGEGWREATVDDVNRSKTDALIFDGLARKRYWVREEPVPPLPTENDTTILAAFRLGDFTRLHLVDGYWHTVIAPKEQTWTPDSLAKSITGFEVLAMPPARVHELPMRTDEQIRRETAKAVLDRVRQARAELRGDATLNRIAREFGVDQ